jgi:hypothetical protein
MSCHRDQSRSMIAVAARRQSLDVQPSRSMRLNNYFCVVCPHHDNLAAKVIRQRMGKSVYLVSFVSQIGLCL